ncbi:helix-turn-helix domain-containing protein [Kitasatospora sp. NPDC094028]
MTRPLTPHEADVLRYTAQGCTPWSIAQALGTDQADVRNTIARACRALGARTRDEAIQLANQPTQPRLFHLQRDTDITGISGTGIIAHGVQWPDGTVTIRWTGDRPSTVNWASIADAIHIHGHGGHTRIVWADAPRTA